MAKQLKRPTRFMPAKVRINSKGQVHIEVNPSGAGIRFAKCVKSVEARGGARDARAVCASAGRKKYGKKKFSAMAAAGRRRKRNTLATRSKKGARGRTRRRTR